MVHCVHVALYEALSHALASKVCLNRLHIGPTLSWGCTVYDSPSSDSSSNSVGCVARPNTAGLNQAESVILIH